MMLYVGKTYSIERIPDVQILEGLRIMVFGQNAATFTLTVTKAEHHPNEFLPDSVHVYGLECPAGVVMHYDGIDPATTSVH